MKPSIAITIALAACTTTSDTRVHLTVTADPSQAMDHYQILVGDKAAVAQPLAALDVEVPGELAGSAQMLDVWGLDGGQQVAFGTTSVTPILHQTVMAEVTLAAASCGSACTLGDSVCSGSGTSTCQLVGSCLAFGPPAACGSGQVCSAGACGAPPTCAQDGGSCDDDNPCTIDDTCTSGTCSGTPKCTTAPANAVATCSSDGTCDFACNSGYMRSGSTCVDAPKTVFITSASYTGNLGGLAGADAKCQALASAANLTGTYKAWLTDGTTSAGSRLTHSTAPYELVGGAVIANSWADLTSGTLRDYLDADETGQTHGENTRAWTNTAGDGASQGPTFGGHCSNWTSASSSPVGGGGYVGFLDDEWTFDGADSCDVKDHLYCFEQ